MDSGTLLRLGIFAGILAFMAISERLLERRPRQCSTPRRWTQNFGLGICGVISIQLLMWILPIAVAVGAAHQAQESNFGLFSVLGLNSFANLIGTLIVLDLTIYTQHVVFHRVPLLWRLHRVHHTDLELDVSSALRFHPIEIFISMLIKSLVVFFSGARPEGVLIFEIILNGMAMFNHANIKIPLLFDRIIRAVLVTPDMHRVHHSVVVQETDSNFGFNLSFWDRLFRTYRAEPEQGHLGMKIGLESFRNETAQNLPWLLRLPFSPRKKGVSD